MGLYTFCVQSQHYFAHSDLDKTQDFNCQVYQNSFLYITAALSPQTTEICRTLLDSFGVEGSELLFSPPVIHLHKTNPYCCVWPVIIWRTWSYQQITSLVTPFKRRCSLDFSLIFQKSVAFSLRTSTTTHYFPRPIHHSPKT